MQNSLFRKLLRPFEMAAMYWRTYGGLRGTCGKLRSYARRYGVSALARRLLAILRSSWSSGPQRRAMVADAGLDGMVQLDAMSVKTADQDVPSICIHIHLFYADLAGEFRDHLRLMPFPYTLLVSVVTPEDASLARETFKDLPTCRRCTVSVVENRGRDLAPFFCTFGEEIARHEIAAHFHSKKSLHAGGMGNLWREYLLRGLLGSTEDIARIISLFRENQLLGLAYPQTFQDVPFWGHHWLANRARVASILAGMGRSAPDDTLCDFPVGSMFWARTAALRPLLQLKLKTEDFDEEKGQLDGTLAHALERLIGYLATQEGYEHAVFNMPENPQQLRWGLDQSNDMEGKFRDVLRYQNIRVVIFDIFDTLLLRPLRDADDTKKITAERLAAEDAKIYRAWRVKAEEEARTRLRKDVDLDEIFQALADLATISPERAATMQDMETEVELRSVSANPSIVELVDIARESGVRVVYASDMFLKRGTILQMLRENGVPEPDHFYLSNEINKRKDTGEMQPYILECEGVSIEEAFMIGDNPRSDNQIPSDMRMAIRPVPRMTDMLKASPRYAWLAQESFTSAADSLSIGLVLRHMHEQARPLDALARYGFFRDFYGIGYGILGPVLTGFAAWLAEMAREKDIETLYFFARDGKIMRHAYEAWRQRTGEGPPSEYLEVSRRAVSVPAFETFEDVMAVLSLQFKGASCRMLFEERLGIELSDEDVRQLQSQGLWPDFSDESLDDDQKLAQLRETARALWPRIQEQAKRERAAALAYLESMNLAGNRNVGVVDVGYTGSIQRHISKLIGHPLHGFYLLTGSAIPRADAPQKGLFAYIAKDCPVSDLFMILSFKMEKLLSASEGQVVSYRETEAGTVEVLRREFSEQERAYDAIREELRAGLDAFIRDAGIARETLYPGFTPTHHTAAAMWLQLEGLPVLDSELLLDDFYCEGSLI